MNQKGFTLIELLTSLALTSVVCILLFQIIFSLKDIYVNDSVKTEILIKKSNITEKINSTFETNISTIRDCENKNTNCIRFTMVDGKIYELSLKRNTRNDAADSGATDNSTNAVASTENDDIISFSDILINDDGSVSTNSVFSTTLSDSTIIYEDLDVCYYYNLSDNNSFYDTFIKIRIPLEDNLLDEKFDINVIYQYNGDDYPSLLGGASDENIVTYIPHC